MKYRNIFLVAVSYIFYGWWDYRFLSLIIISSFVDFFAGNKIFKESNTRKRKTYLIISILVNIGFLGFFKYYNFFVDSFINTFRLFGAEFSSSSLNIILPVGISFYTFQTLSYTLDIYFKKMEPTKELFGFFAFVSFFPQLVAGPIERAKNLLPQFYTEKKLNYEMLQSGLLLMAWGFFKKIVIADRLARYVDAGFADAQNLSGLPAIISVLFFTFQLYLDFSAYSDIAIGSARTLGFKLSINFRRPYISASFSDFWKRWHISLSSWFRDYVYIPLGGSRKGKWATWKNVMIVFLISGLWHGASWNFVIWGGINGLFILLLDGILLKLRKGALSKFLVSLFITLCWAASLVFFRAQTFMDAISIYGNFGFGNTEELFSYSLTKNEFRFSIIMILALIIFEYFQENIKQLQEWFTSTHVIFRWSVYFILGASIVFLGSYGNGINDSNFIYFQF